MLCKGQKIKCVQELYLQASVTQPIKHVFCVTIGANTKVVLAYYTHNAFV